MISTQHALMIGRESQIERLTFDLNRLIKDGREKSAHLPNSIWAKTRTALKLLDVCQGISITLADMLELSLLRVKQYEKSIEPEAEAGNEEIFRSEMVTVSTAVHIESIITRVISRANEDLAATKLALMAADYTASASEIASADAAGADNSNGLFQRRVGGLNMQLISLKQLTMSYAEDLVVQRANIAQHDTPETGDSYAIKTQKEILQMLSVFAQAQMQKAIALVDIAIGCPPRDDADFASRSATLAGFGVAAATMAKFIVDMLGDVIAATGTICITKPQLN